MSDFEKALLATLLLAALVNFNHPRALMWLAAGACSYIISSLYYETGAPLHPFVTALCDATVCLLIYSYSVRYGGVKWELPLFLVFQLSVLISFVQLFRVEADYVYALSLELVNWAALFIIIGAGTMRLADVYWSMGGGLDHSSHLHRLVHSVSAPQKLDWWARIFSSAR